MADRLDDLICTFHPGAGTMETLAILLLGWIIFGTILTVVGKLVYSRLLDAPPEAQSLNSTAPPLATPVAPTTTEKPTISNTERFINTLKANPPPAPPPKLPRSKSASRQSSVERSSTTTSHQHPEVPIVAGSNADCVKWVTNCFSHVYSKSQILAELTASWKDSLNSQTKQSEADTGVSVEIQQIIFQDDFPPRLANVFCEIIPHERTTITGDFESRFCMTVRAKREQRDLQSISDYRLSIERFRGRLNVSADFRDSIASMKFDGWPEVRVIIVKDDNQPQVSQTGTKGNDELLLQDIIIEMVTSALRSATNHLNWGRHPDFPRFVPSVNPAEPILPVHYDSMLETRLRRSAKDKKLLVKVVKANSIGSQKGVHQLYCIIEMDDPPQRHQTTVKQGTENPFWDENFLFDLGPNTEEILFELYNRERNKTTFLGLGIVGMEELLMNPSQRQIIPLQSRPYENDPVSGTLTVEFLFIDGTDLPKSLSSGEHTFSSPITPSDGESHFKRRDSYHRATQRQYDLPAFVNGGEKPAATSSPTKQLEARIPSPRQSRFFTGVMDAKPALNEVVEANKEPYYPETERTSGMGSLASSLSSTAADERARSRSRRRSFFRNLKERLSRSKNRSRSVDPGIQERDDSLNRDDPMGRSVSADRARSGQLLAVPGLAREFDSTHSSLSEVSVVSNTSTRTFLDEASTLVIEATENGIKKHYLIPMALAEKRKWKKKGVKLHIYSDHVFVAKHLTGGSLCQVCNAPLARRPGKNGYECRDCLLRCHKPCHVKADSLCPNSTVHFMELEFVEDTGAATAERKPRRL